MYIFLEEQKREKEFYEEHEKKTGGKLVWLNQKPTLKKNITALIQLFK